jgi:hypothetical protein
MCLLQLAAALSEMRTKLATEHEMSAKTHKELEADLGDTKHRLLDVQHHLAMAEKVRRPVHR